MEYWTMDAVGRSRLALREGPVPEPGPREVLVQVAAVALNHRDRLAIDHGLTMVFPESAPFVPGSDMAGVVVAAGPEVDRFTTGDRVVTTCLPGWLDGPGPGDARLGGPEALGSGHHPGVLAEYVVLHQDWVVAAPRSLPPAEASTLPCAGLAAWSALVEHGHLRAGETVLVQGTGGVALFGLQIAVAHGAEVIVTSGDAAKLARAGELGAARGVDRSDGDWVEAVLAVTADRGVDHVLDTVGGPNTARSLRVAAVGGRVSLIGVLDGFELSGQIADVARKKLTIAGIQVGHRRALEDLVRAIDRTGITPVVAGRYAMADLPAALAHTDRGPFGKVVVEVGGP